MSEYMQAIVESFSKLPVELRKAETFCSELAIIALKPKMGNFEKIESHFDADGLVTTYKCARDGRTYTVKITASKP